MAATMHSCPYMTLRMNCASDISLFNAEAQRRRDAEERVLIGTFVFLAFIVWYAEVLKDR